MFQTYFDILYVSVGQYQAEEKGLVRSVHSYASKRAIISARMLVRGQIFLLVNLSDFELYRVFWCCQLIIRLPGKSNDITGVLASQLIDIIDVCASARLSTVTLP